MMLLAVVNSSAIAEWVKVGDNDAETATVYIDPATIRKDGSKAKMWRLFDFKRAEASFGDPYRSMMSEADYDCNEKQQRILTVSLRSGNMGEGELVFSTSDPDKWLPVQPESVSETLWQIACGKR